MAAIALLAPAAFVASIVASPASGVTPTLLARGTYEEFKESAVRDSPIEFKAKTKSPIDIVVRRHDYVIGSTTGWHTHPGPVFITVTQGQLTYYLYDDRELHAARGDGGTGNRRRGRGHMVRNESGQAAQE